jgi:hypothetical protein
VLEALFILLEFLSPSRRIFIGSHSLPLSLVRCIGPSTLLSLDASHAIQMRVLRFEVSGLHHRTPVKPVHLTGQTGTHRSDRSGAAAVPSSVLRSWLCGSSKEPNGFLVNHWKPRELGVAPLMTWLPRSLGSILVLRLNQETVHDFILLFMPPCGPHLTPLATGSLERSLLVFSTPGGLTGDDLSCLFFTCTNTGQAATCTCNT